MSLNEKLQSTKISYPIVDSGNKGTLCLSPELKSQIDTFHSFAGSTEWSGILLYTIDKGDIFDPAKLQITAKGMFPMDIGSPGYTEYEFDEYTLDMYDFYPDALKEEWRLGHIHTHHNMQAYFSGTDLQELRDNIDNHVYYLSLIVNFKGEYCAKICVKGSRTVKENSVLEYKGLLSDESTIQRHKQEREEDIVYAVDMDIKISESTSGPSFIDELIKLKDRQKVQKTSYTNTYGRGAYGNNTPSVHPDYKSSQLDIWGGNNLSSIGHTENGFSGTERETNTFIARLINVDPNFKLESTIENEIKVMKKKYDNMTAADQALYLSYLNDNITLVLSTISLESRSSISQEEKTRDLCEEAIMVLEVWTSSSYGYNQYEEGHFVDEVCNLLEGFVSTLPGSKQYGIMDW